MTNPNYDLETDIAIIGAGPAGTSTSIFLAKKGIKHIIFDKANFPRDKICGDGLSGKVVSLLKQLDQKLFDELATQSDIALPSWGVRFVAPNRKMVDIPFYIENREDNQPPGFVSKRVDFDQLLFKNIDRKIANFHLDTEITNIEYVDEGILLSAKHKEKIFSCFAKMVIGAEGDRSIVAKKLARHTMQPEHYYAGLRVYYENVSDLHHENFIELHFIKDLLPGYFWIFPLPNNQANVGLGILTNLIKKKNINLKKTLFKIINEQENIKYRFKNARMIDEVRGWGLPLGSSKRKLSGSRFLLTGDAGSLIDPLTGEGIGNALQSALVAAEIIENAIKNNNFSAEFLKEYDNNLYQQLGDELKLSKNIQSLVQMPWLFNFVFNRLHNNKSLQELFSAMLNDLDLRAKLRSPAFYLRILFNR